MAHPLDIGMTSPPPPRPDAGQQQQQMAPRNALMGGNALMNPQPRQMPAPSHIQTVAAIRHFMAIIDELQVLEKNPDLGRTNCRGAIIDGVSKLVAERMLSPANAVIQLAKIPDDPLLQRKAIQQMLQQTIQAQNNVLDHHVATHPATLDWAHESQHQAGSMDDHMATMEGLAGHYRPAPNGR
jgi:hypothetical protein